MHFIKKLTTILTLSLVIFFTLAAYLLLYPLKTPQPPLEDLTIAKTEFEKIMLSGYGHDTERKHLADIIYFAQIIPKFSDSDIVLTTPHPGNTTLKRGNYLTLHGGPIYGLRDDKTEYYLFANEITQHYNPTWISWGDASLLYQTDYYLLKRDPNDGNTEILSTWSTKERAAGYLVHNKDIATLFVRICGRQDVPMMTPKDFNPDLTWLEDQQLRCQETVE